MEKMGVVLDDEKTKQASAEVTCPSCRTKFALDPSVNPPRCPHCGSTEFFEKRRE